METLLQYYRSTTAVLPQYYCSTTAVLLQYYCSTTAVQLQYPLDIFFIYSMGKHFFSHFRKRSYKD